MKSEIMRVSHEQQAMKDKIKVKVCRRNINTWSLVINKWEMTTEHMVLSSGYNRDGSRALMGIFWFCPMNFF